MNSRSDQLVASECAFAGNIFHVFVSNKVPETWTFVSPIVSPPIKHDRKTQGIPGVSERGMVRPRRLSTTAFSCISPESLHSKGLFSRVMYHRLYHRGCNAVQSNKGFNTLLSPKIAPKDNSRFSRRVPQRS